jgi:hypothetical protein
VEIANLYAMLLLMWGNMDPVDPNGNIAPFTSPRHGFPLIAGGILKPISSKAYIDNAKRFIAMPKSEHSCNEFFNMVHGYCDLLADLLLVIKMGRNMKKCMIYLYNIPQGTPIPEFTSTVWSFDAQGPMKGSIATVTMFRDIDGNLICYDVPKSFTNNMPDHIKLILADWKYLGVTSNAQLDLTEGKKKIANKLTQRIAITAKNTDTIQEAKIIHNMIACRVATFSPLCISMSLMECNAIDKQLINAYKFRMKFMPSDAKHSIFLSLKEGGIGVRSFTRKYIGALLRDVEVFISNTNSLTTHAILSSIEQAAKKQLWNLYKERKIPEYYSAAEQDRRIYISGRKILSYQSDVDTLPVESRLYDHPHTMEKAVESTCMLGFMLRNLDQEFCSRFVDELLLKDKYTRSIGCPLTTARANLGPSMGEGNKHFWKYSLFGHVYILISLMIEEAKKAILQASNDHVNVRFEELLSRPAFFNQVNCFPKEISAIRLASAA